MKDGKKIFFYLFFLKKGLPSIWKEDHQNFKERKVAAHRIIYGNFHTKGGILWWSGVKRSTRREISEGGREKGEFLWGIPDYLEEKHRGKDWQHASSSHLKPSNSSQRLVLPGMVMWNLHSLISIWS